MRLYLAGPMTSHQNYNFPAFDAKRDELRAQGHIVVSPADLDRAVGFDPEDPVAVATIPIDSAFMKAAVLRDVAAILDCDGVVLLEGWETSRGAAGEVAVARWLGLPVFMPGELLGDAA